MFDLIISNSRQVKYMTETVDDLYSAISKLYFKMHVVENVDIQHFPYHLFRNLNTWIMDTGDVTTFPDEISKLENLEKLEINNNSFIDFPESVTKLKALKELIFFQNFFEVIPSSIKNLHNLETLSIIHCPLKEFPNAILELKTLKELYMCGALNFIIPDNLHELQNLEKLGLHTNGIKNFPECIIHLKKLKYLDISSNKIKNIPTAIEKLTHLGEFILSGNRQMQNCLFLNLPHLKRLVIDRHVNDIILHENVENKIEISNGTFDYNHTSNVRYINEMERITLLRKFKREKMENILFLIPEKMKCSICYNIFLNPRVNQKGNIYCFDCIQQHFRLYDTDPLTNVLCSTFELFPVNILENEINEFIDNFQMTE